MAKAETPVQKVVLGCLITTAVACAGAAGVALHNLKDSEDEVASGKAASSSSIICKWDESNSLDPALVVEYKPGGGLPAQGKELLFCPLPSQVGHDWLLEGTPQPISKHGGLSPAFATIYVNQKTTHIGNNLALTLEAGEATRKEPNSYYRNVANHSYYLRFGTLTQKRLHNQLKEKLEQEKKAASPPPSTPSGKSSAPAK